MIVKYKMGFSFAHERASIRLVLKAPVLPMLAGTQPFQTATPIFGAWRSLVARCNGVAKVAGSNPVAPTKEHSKNRRFRINPSGGFFVVLKQLSSAATQAQPTEFANHSER